MIARIIERLSALHPELEMHEVEKGDLFGSERWGAVLSPAEDGQSLYRYLLWRLYDETKPLLAVLMLNPSKATHEMGDRTVDGLLRRAKRRGYGGILIMNCFAFRATEPADMKRAKDPIGPANDDVIGIVLEESLDLLCAWGVNAVHMDREKEVKCAILSGNAKPHVLRLCANGAPEHPLYIPASKELERWSFNCPDSGG